MKKNKLVEHGISTKMESVVRAAPGFPVGGYTLVFGARSARKSTWVAHMVAKWSRGELEGAWKGKPTATLMISVEDDWKSMTLPRLIAMGADPKMVFSMARGPGRKALRFPKDWELVMSRVQRLRKDSHPLKIVVVDPLASFFERERYEEMRNLMDECNRFAEDTDSLVIVVTHTPKANPDVAIGSVHVEAASKSVWQVRVHPDEPSKSVVIHRRDKTAKEQPPRLLHFEIVPVKGLEGDFQIVSSEEQIDKLPWDPWVDVEDAAAFISNLFVLLDDDVMGFCKMAKSEMKTAGKPQAIAGRWWLPFLLIEALAKKVPHSKPALRKALGKMRYRKIKHTSDTGMTGWYWRPAEKKVVEETSIMPEDIGDIDEVLSMLAEQEAAENKVEVEASKRFPA